MNREEVAKRPFWIGGEVSEPQKMRYIGDIERLFGQEGWGAEDPFGIGVVRFIPDRDADEWIIVMPEDLEVLEGSDE